MTTSRGSIGDQVANDQVMLKLACGTSQSERRPASSHQEKRTPTLSMWLSVPPPTVPS